MDKLKDSKIIKMEKLIEENPEIGSDNKNDHNKI